MILKQAGDYRSTLRQLALDYYHRRISFIDFRLRMVASIGSGLTEAWLSGREIWGITQGLTFPERLVLYREISREIRYIQGLSTAIDVLANGGKDIDLISRRLDLWGDAFIRTQELSKTYNGKDQFLRWVLNPAEHCGTCLSLEGKVQTARQWLAMGYYPKSWSLDCGQGCKCGLDMAQEPNA